jgi:hypothetical protein
MHYVLDLADVLIIVCLASSARKLGGLVHYLRIRFFQWVFSTGGSCLEQPRSESLAIIKSKVAASLVLGLWFLRRISALRG